MPKDQAAAIDVTSVRAEPKEFLKAVLDGLIYDGFRFPTSGPDGCIGSFCISKALTVSVPNTKERLALHLNFGCVPADYKPGSLKLKVTHFHLTARAARSQLLINDAGPSSITAGASIHINRNTEWGRTDNVTALAHALSIPPAEMLAQLIKVEGYTRTYMNLAATRLKDNIKQTVSVNVGETAIDWSASDSTFV